MNHECIVNDHSHCNEINGNLYIHTRYDNVSGHIEYISYQVNFCPECGYNIPKQNTSDLLKNPYEIFMDYYNESNKDISDLKRDLKSLWKDHLFVRIFQSKLCELIPSLTDKVIQKLIIDCNNESKEVFNKLFTCDKNESN
jgi:hypothetical protein